MSDIKKFAYTLGTVFTLTGSDYIGYYNIKDNIGYVGKYDQKVKLDNNQTIQNTVTLSDKFYNRTPIDNVTLNYSLCDFVFQPGEFINSNSINLKLEKAFDNFLETYKSCFIASSDLPYYYTNSLRISATNTSLATPVWNYSNANTNLSGFSAYNPNITRSSKIAFMPNRYASDVNNHTLVVANSASICVFKINRQLTTCNVVFSSSRVETNNTIGYNALTFTNITSIAKATNALYICDAGNKAVYAYDITSVIEEDRALGNRFNLRTTLNSKTTNLVDPLLVAASDDRIYVYDSAGIIYFFDTSFNLINSYKNKRLFNASEPVSMTHYKIYDQLYVLTKDGTVLILDALANSTITKFNLTGFAQQETPLKIIFSNSNSDILYFLTNYGIYKKYVSNLKNNIGNFTFTSVTTGMNGSYAIGYKLFSYFYDIDTYDSLDSSDNILVYGYDQFINYSEKTLFNTILK